VEMFPLGALALFVGYPAWKYQLNVSMKNGKW